MTNLNDRIRSLESQTAPFAPARLRWHRDGKLPTDERLAHACLMLDADLLAIDAAGGRPDAALADLIQRALVGDLEARQALAEHHRAARC